MSKAVSICAFTWFTFVIGFVGYSIGVSQADHKAMQARERCNQRWVHRISRGKESGMVSEDFERLTPEPRMFLMED